MELHALGLDRRGSILSVDCFSVASDSYLLFEGWLHFFFFLYFFEKSTLVNLHFLFSI